MANEPLLVGAAEIDITPPLGVSLCGYFVDRKASGVLDPLFAHAFVLRQGDEAVVLVSGDLIFPSRRVTAEARRLIEQNLGVPGERVLVHATHTHTGPFVDRELPWDEAGSALFPGALDESYLAMLPRRLASAAQAAWKRLQPAPGLGWAVGEVEGIAFNRRFRMKDGSVRTNPGRLNPDIVEPAAPADPSVLVAWAGGDSPALVNFAVHQDITGGDQISADMPAHMNAVLRRALGRGMPAFYFNGCCGDINHIDVSKPDGDGYEHSVRMGQTLAGEVLKTLPWIEPKPVDAVAGATRVVEIPVRQVSADELARAEALLAEAGSDVQWPENTEVDSEEGFRRLQILWAHGTVSLARATRKTDRVEVQALRLGDLAVVGLPGEIFCEHGLRIKAQAPFPAVMVVELANEWHGYIPTRRAFEEGGYETQHRSAWLCESAGDMMVDAALELLDELA